LEVQDVEVDEKARHFLKNKKPRIFYSFLQ